MTVQEILEFDISKSFEFKDDKEKQEFLTEFGSIFVDNLTERILPLMDAQAQTKFSEILDKEETDENAIFSFFAESIPTFPEVLGDELLRTKHEFISVLTLTK